jgi:hypothetical protein
VLAIDLKIAKALGLTVLLSLLGRADEVIIDFTSWECCTLFMLRCTEVSQQTVA